MAQETAKIQKMFQDGEFALNIYIYILNKTTKPYNIRAGRLID